METAQDMRQKPKKRTTVIGIAIALIVTLSVVAVVALSRAHQGDRSTVPIIPGVSQIPGGVNITLYFIWMNNDTRWTNVTILLTDGVNTTRWLPISTDLDNGITTKWNNVTAAPNLGTLKVNISIVDVAGNGFINQGDYITLTVGTGQTFSTATTYTLTIMDNPLSVQICHASFQGH